jgi:hypothetical protein
MSTARVLVCVALGLAAGSAALGGPSIERLAQAGDTQVVLYSVSPLAMVRQQLQVHLDAGGNRITFTWAGGKIDAASVRLSTPPGLSLGGSTRPAGTEKTLAWDVAADAEGDYQITVMYLLSDLKWSPSYRLTYAPGSTTARLEGCLTLTNESGLPLEDVEAQLVLGRPGAGPGEAEPLAPTAFALTDMRSLPLGARLRTRFLPPLLLPVHLVHRIDSERAAETVQRILVVQPPSSGSLAQEALPKGALEVILADPRGLTRPLLSTELSYKPTEEFELALPPEADVLVERVMLDQRKQSVEFDRLGRVSGFDTVEHYRIEVRNRRPEAVDLEVVETVLDTWDFATRALHTAEDGKVVMQLSVPAGEAAALEFTLTKHSGSRIP